MNKGLTLAAATILATCVSVLAQERPLFESMNLLDASRAVAAGRAQIISDGSVSLGSTYAPPAPLSLIENDPFTFMQAFAWSPLTPTVLRLPVSVSSPLVLATTALQPSTGMHPVPMQSRSISAWGEMGGLYGTTLGGRSSLEVKEGYIFGGINNDRTQVTVGASYSNWRGSLPGNSR